MNDDTRNLIETAREFAVQKISDNGRERVLAHSEMIDLTKNPPGRAATLETLESFFAWIERHCKKDEASVFLNTRAPEFVAFASERWGYRDGKALYKLELSRAFLRWFGTRNPAEVFGYSPRVFTQEGLVKMFEAFSSDTAAGVSPVILSSLRNLSLAATVSYKREMQDENNLRFEFQIAEAKSAPGAATIPREWLFDIPLFEGEESVEIPARLCYKIPTSQEQAQQQARFSFEAPSFVSLYIQAVDRLLSYARERLAGFHVYRGEVSHS